MEFDFTEDRLLGRHGQLFHIGVACRRLEDAMHHLGKLFDVRWTPIADDTAPNLFTKEGPSQWSARRTHSIGSPIPFELLEGSAGSTWNTPKLATTHHVAYWSPEVGADVRALEAQGWEVELALLDADGNPTEFAYLIQPAGVRVELVDVRRRPGYLALTSEQ
jgi:hypothetical protein